MPPRFAYWTLLIDDKPTAFRARDRQDLVPTMVQLQRTNQNVVMKWFAQGRLWESPEAQRESWLRKKAKVAERRGRDWRPGGDHRDPRARFDRERQRKSPREDRADRPPRESRPWHDRPPRGDSRLPARSSQGGSASGGGWQNKPAGGAPQRRDRPWKDRPPRGPKHSGGGGWHGKPAGGPPGKQKPWQRPPRRDKPFPPRGSPSGQAGGGGWRPRKRRKDEPDGEK